MPLRIAPWPIDNGNPYQRLFYRELAPSGVSVVPGLQINDDYLRAHRSEIDVIHLHWPEYIWRVGVHSAVGQLRRIAGFRGFLAVCRELGIPIIWTAHNLRPHEETWLDRFGLRLVRRSSDFIIAHSERTADSLRRGTAASVVVMPHGNYDGEYPPPRGRTAVLEEVGLRPDLPVAALIGALRPYKGVQFAIDAIKVLEGRVQLIVAGYPKPGFDLAALEEQARRQPWLAVVPRSLTEQEFSDYVGASTTVLLPYTRLTTSAVLLAGWTLGRGAVTSREPYFEDLLARHPDAGRSADVRSPVDFARAVSDYLQVPEAARWAEARKAADAYRWSTCVMPVVDALRPLMNGTPETRKLG